MKKILFLLGMSIFCFSCKDENIIRETNHNLNSCFQKTLDIEKKDSFTLFLDILNNNNKNHENIDASIYVAVNWVENRKKYYIQFYNRPNQLIELMLNKLYNVDLNYIFLVKKKDPYSQVSLQPSYINAFEFLSLDKKTCSDIIQNYINEGYKVENKKMFPLIK
jgi:hypothetical protein